MSANATDERLSFSAAPEKTRRVSLDAASRVTSEALMPGKYFVRILGLGVNTAWVKLGPFSASTPVTATVPGALAAAGDNAVHDEFPIDSLTLSFTFHVRKGVNDQIAVIMSAGTGTLVATKTGV